MNNNLKKEIEKDFNKEENYKAILSKVEGVSNMKNFKARYVLVPAFAVCMLTIVFYGAIMINNSFSGVKTAIDYNGKYNWIKKEIYFDLNDVEGQSDVVLHWDEKTITQQFYFAEYDGKKYDSQHTKILSENVGKKLGTVVLTGEDAYTNIVYTKNADVYEIKTISSEWVIALQFEGTSEYYVYVNIHYRPTTLGELIEDLNLKEIMTFGTVKYSYLDTTKKENQQIVNVEFYDVKDEDVWNMLLSDENLENVYNDTGNYNYYSDKFVKGVKISVDIPLLGYENISIELTDKGYLITNILGTGKGFYIGEEKVEEFIDYISKTYQGYEIVIVYPDIEEEPKKEDDRIMMYDNTTHTETEVDMNSIMSNSQTNRTLPNEGSSSNVIGNTIKGIISTNG